MEQFLQSGIDIRTLSSLTLAYMGDGIFELLIRESIISKGGCKPSNLHIQAVAMTKAVSQAAVARAVFPLLPEDEAAVFKRGRNAKAGHSCKSASVDDYHMATALETVFGYLYLSGNMARLRELFSLCLTHFELLQKK